MVDPHDLNMTVLLFPVAPIETPAGKFVFETGICQAGTPVYFARCSWIRLCSYCAAENWHTAARFLFPASRMLSWPPNRQAFFCHRPVHQPFEIDPGAPRPGRKQRPKHCRPSGCAKTATCPVPEHAGQQKIRIAVNNFIHAEFSGQKHLRPLPTRHALCVIDRKCQDFLAFSLCPISASTSANRSQPSRNRTSLETACRKNLRGRLRILPSPRVQAISVHEPLGNFFRRSASSFE
jgi:hypothetical protein